MVTAGTKTKGNTDVPDNLASHSQEEADTLLLLHATTISDDAELTISSPDTDVFLQIIRMYPKLPKKVFFLTGKSKQRRKIPIRPIYEKIGPKASCSPFRFLFIHGIRHVWQICRENKRLVSKRLSRV